LEGNYCKLDADVKAMMAENSEGPNVTTFCKPGSCGMKWMTYMFEFALVSACSKGEETDSCKDMKDDVEGQISFFTAACFKKGDKYCMDYVNKGPPKWDDIAKECGFPKAPTSDTAATVGTTCSDACKPVWQSMDDNWGCCLATLATTVEDEFFDALGRQFSSCGITDPPAPCSGGEPLSFKVEVRVFLTCEHCLRGCCLTVEGIRVQVSNLAWTWYEASAGNKKLVTTYVRDALFEAYGVPKKLVTVTGAEMSDGEYLNPS